MDTNKDKVSLLLILRPESKVYYYDNGLSFYIGEEIPEGVQLYVEDGEDGYPIEEII